MNEKPSNKLLTCGLAGALVAALCCFNPILLILLAAVGLGAAVKYLDWVLLPALVFFMGLTVYALSKRKPASCVEKNPPFGEK